MLQTNINIPVQKYFPEHLKISIQSMQEVRHEVKISIFYGNFQFHENVHQVKKNELPSIEVNNERVKRRGWRNVSDYQYIYYTFAKSIVQKPTILTSRLMNPMAANSAARRPSLNDDDNMELQLHIDFCW